MFTHSTRRLRLACDASHHFISLKVTNTGWLRDSVNGKRGTFLSDPDGFICRYMEKPAFYLINEVEFLVFQVVPQWTMSHAAHGQIYMLETCTHIRLGEIPLLEEK